MYVYVYVYIKIHIYEYFKIILITKIDSTKLIRVYNYANKHDFVSFLARSLCSIAIGRQRLYATIIWVINRKSRESASRCFGNNRR